MKTAEEYLKSKGISKEEFIEMDNSGWVVMVKDLLNEYAEHYHQQKMGGVMNKTADIIRFIESDLIEIKLYGNDGFDNQEELDGKEYLVRLIKEAVGKELIDFAYWVIENVKSNDIVQWKVDEYLKSLLKEEE